MSNRSDPVQETSDGYQRVIAILGDRWRVIECRDSIQWILQRRENGTAKRPWRAVGYFRTRKALIRVCGGFNREFHPGALTALDHLPEVIGQAKED